ncbi:uncharacterized protein LOC141934042 isoform X5 [Strix aluco]|uniref:uncharacterized protein LOC141934042 isoform X5 n=1 Tax=Strix aluco TaxID=111821 RepID=UPI003DA4CCAA
MRLARGRGKGPRGEEQSPEGSGAPRQRLDGLCRVPLVPSPGAGFLAVPDRLHEINVDLLGRWLCDHQAPSGGRGGEAEKGPRGEEQSPEGSGAPRQRLDGLCRVPLVPSPGAGFLAVPDRLHEINVDLLGRWLCDHQAPSGGRGGEAEKGPRGEEQSPEGSGAPRQRLDGLCRVPLVPSPGAGFLAVPDRLHEINVDLLGRWLCDHQAPSGGRGGEAEKGPRGEEQSPEGSGAPRQRLDGLCRVPLVPSPGAGFLAVPDRLHEINVDLLGRWLCDHQAPSGGRGGEAEKGPRGEEQSPEGSGAPRQRLDGLCRVPLVPSPGAGFLAVPDRLHEINVDLLGRWLCDHQAPSGGRGGEAEKGPRGEEQSPEGSGAPRQRLDGLCRVPLVPSPGAGFLAVPDRLHEINVDLLGRWLCDHQAPSGGRGGEAEKVTLSRKEVAPQLAGAVTHRQRWLMLATLSSFLQLFFLLRSSRLLSHSTSVSHLQNTS